MAKSKTMYCQGCGWQHTAPVGYVMSNKCVDCGKGLHFIYFDAETEQAKHDKILSDNAARIERDRAVDRTGVPR